MMTTKAYFGVAFIIFVLLFAMSPFMLATTARGVTLIGAELQARFSGVGPASTDAATTQEDVLGTTLNLQGYDQISTGWVDMFSASERISASSPRTTEGIPRLVVGDWAPPTGEAFLPTNPNGTIITGAAATAYIDKRNTQMAAAAQAKAAAPQSSTTSSAPSTGAANDATQPAL